LAPLALETKRCVVKHRISR